MRRTPGAGVRENINWTVFSIGATFALFESAYFGWNRWPHSDAEIICDGIAFIIIAMSARMERK